ncbi:hypothetical protein [Longitalea arenae]|uniref:hypothetical protein n=1 Tax=Longitalea arenae TaxID=2812558 RepID=UPI001967EC71|nr:hypothetical protein [Longitalea arenae]
MTRSSTISFFTLLLLLMQLAGFAQRTGKLNGVFAGIEVSQPTVMGQGMQRTDRVIYFRPDGTFNDKLQKADWKTAVAGKYSVAGNQVSLQFNGGAKETMTLEADGDLRANGDIGSYGMLKMGTADRVPPGVYTFRNVSSSGGGASGQVFVGSGATVGIYFDGKGHFTRNAKSATMVTGGHVGGGVSNKDKNTGNYSIRDGFLTLTYTDGKTETHSFFCRPGEKPLMAAINGRIFFMEESKEGPSTNDPNITERTTTSTTSKKNEAAGTAPASPRPATDAHTLLHKANEVQGGEALNELRSIRAHATVGKYTVTSLADLEQKRLRIEMRMGETLIAIEQFNGKGAWKWENGKKKALPAARLEEMKSAFESGILALRRSVISRMTNLEIKHGGNGKSMLTAQLDGKKLVFYFNSQGVLIGDLNTTVLTEYSNHKKVNGILFPFTEKQESGFNKLMIQYTAYDINPVISESDWAER